MIELRIIAAAITIISVDLIMAGTSRAKLRPPLSSLSSSSSRRCTTAISTPHKDKHDFLLKQSTPSLLSPKAYPVYGTHVEFDYNRGSTKNNNSITSSLRIAIPTPSCTDKNNNDTENDSNIINIKGIVILLHACTHNAFKFFSPSNDKCPECVGLSEELQLVRNVLNRGYVAFAVTCSNLQSGCWGGDDDVDRIRYALHEFIDRHYHSIITTSSSSSSSWSSSSPIVVHAIGASSGGSMAAKIMVEGIASTALVMVMSLRNQLIDKLLEQKQMTSKQDSIDSTTTTTTTKVRRLYLAPMTKDQGTAKRVRENYNYLMGKQQKQKILQSLSSSQNNNNYYNNLDVVRTSLVEVIVDEDSCRSLPVTVDYLWNRVPGMTLEVSTIIVDVLIKANHIDPNNNHLLIVDPTKSNWRDLLLQQQQQQDTTTKDGIVHIPKSLQQQQQKHQQKQPFVFAKKLSTTTSTTKSNNMLLWGTFDLTPGMSPLAKALHRAWAMHEYCSESINPALDFFEQ
ncbi:hypothetical protein FRACYDRAFT_252847 [Fragilariopsis cylindrus CCMP1102]|uniref:Uncharacterized protein n=1 Tax=Fragilariopsis cylindrus CCMP1102 TaxID=635003 RepID=A0A1E7ELM8_9STRA|nr:hypothetical protein FRACYDRAFT_252847 [Fragilariopsis cylindrus CCMP1102]|eukprot:OEU06821.1 hypothetical protein FRACYDRAFT_252847 [Fragilariopsis cylindrus CCMP1102]